MKPRTQSVSATLEPWVAVFAQHGHAKLSSVHSPSGSATTVIEFVLPSLDAAFVGLDDVTRLREALYVLHLAATVDAASVEDAVAGLFYHDFTGPEAGDDLLEKSDSPRTAECEHVEFVLTFYGTRGRFLEEVVAPALFSEPHSPSAEVLAARCDLLHDSLAENKPLCCRVNVVSMDDSFDDDVETDYIQRLVSFIRILDSGRNSNQSQGISVSVSAIQLELNELAITSEAVQAVASLSTVKIPINCFLVAIDPAELACSAEELAKFLNAVGSNSSEVAVEIGHVTVREYGSQSGRADFDQPTLVRKIFRGIAGASCVTSVSFGPLLAMANSASQRGIVWQELFSCLTSTSPSVRVSSLVVSPQISLTAEDAAFIRDAIDSYGVLPVSKLSMWLSESDPDAILSLIKAVSLSVESITLHSEWDAVTPAKITDALSSDCPRLETLSLAFAEIESLSRFAGKSTRLRELSLDSVILRDPSSTSAFFLALADTRTHIAKSLRKLHVKAGNNASDLLTIGEGDADILTQVLETNKVLSDIELAVADGDIKSLVAINSHNNEVLPEPMALREKLAFLSATRPCTAQVSHQQRNRVDEDAVRLIFAFAAERVTRRVYLDF